MKMTISLKFNKIEKRIKPVSKFVFANFTKLYYFKTDLEAHDFWYEFLIAIIFHVLASGFGCPLDWVPVGLPTQSPMALNVN